MSRLWSAAVEVLEGNWTGAATMPAPHADRFSWTAALTRHFLSAGDSPPIPRRATSAGTPAVGSAS